MKRSFGAITLEYKGDKFTMAFNKPNYTYQHMTIDELESFWQEIMNFCHEFRRQEQIAKVSN